MATVADMAYFGASDAACYEFPGENEAHLRDAYCRGAAKAADRIEALEAALGEVNARANTHVMSLAELKTVLSDIRQIIACAALPHP